jgi:hypothetical protein
MQHKNLLDMLARQGLVRDGDAWVVPNNVQATVYMSLDEESLIVDRVTRLEVFGEHAAIVTQRKERYTVEVEGIRALRFVSDAK